MTATTSPPLAVSSAFDQAQSAGQAVETSAELAAPPPPVPDPQALSNLETPQQQQQQQQQAAQNQNHNHQPHLQQQAPAHQLPEQLQPLGHAHPPQPRQSAQHHQHHQHQHQHPIQPQHMQHMKAPAPIPNQQHHHLQHQHQQHQHQTVIMHPQSSDACASIVQSLLCHSCGDNEFSKRAIESLVKKMKEKRDELDALITAVTTSGAVATPCVTIQRTLDGRLQVAGRKGFPNVIYARIWRWPDLTKNELRPTKTCAHAFNQKSDLICVNPYHYDRVVVSPGIDLSTLSLSSSDEVSLADIQRPKISSVHICASTPPQDHQLLHQHMQQQHQLQQQQLLLNQEQHHHHHQNNNDNADNINHQQHLQPQPQQLSHQQPTATSANSAELGPVLGHGIQQLGTGCTINPEDQASLKPQQCSTQPPPKNWCSIAYFELDQQVGETFRCSSSNPSVTIDGFTNPSAPDRLCIGFLFNVHRTPAVHKARLHIGNGVRLETRNEGDVWIENLSDNAVFLSSPYLDQQSRRPMGNVVHKIYPRALLKVFDLRETHSLLKLKAEAARRAAAAQAAAVAGTGNSATNNNNDQLADAAIGVDDLRRYCILSMSFVKGWGLDYPRSSIKNCPCWIEVHLHRALQLLDEVLQLKL